MATNKKAGCRVKATFRLKKFDAGQDPEKDEPRETLERSVEVTEAEASDITHGRSWIDAQPQAGRAYVRSREDNRVLRECAIIPNKTIINKEQL